MLVITAGDTVTWTNRDSALHSVVFLAGLGQTRELRPRPSSSLRFITPGTYRYIRGLHGQSMSGAVMVNPADGPIAVVVRGADEAPVVPADTTSTSVDARRAAVFAGIGALVVYLLTRGSALLRRR